MQRGEQLYNKLVSIILSINSSLSELQCDTIICNALDVDYYTL